MRPDEVATRSKVEVVPLGGGQNLVVGSMDQLGQVLRWARDQGRLVKATTPTAHETDCYGRATRYSAVVTLVDHVRPVIVTTPTWYRRPRFLVAVLVGVVMTLVGAGWVIYLIFPALVAALKMAAAAAVVILVLLALMGGRSFSGTFQGRMH